MAELCCSPRIAPAGSAAPTSGCPLARRAGTNGGSPMKPSPHHGLLILALALAACRRDSTGVPPETLAIAPLASISAEDPPRYSDWSAPVNLGAPVNTSFIDQGADISKDGLSLYYFCGNCPDTF